MRANGCSYSIKVFVILVNKIWNCLNWKPCQGGRNHENYLHVLEECLQSAAKLGLGFFLLQQDNDSNHTSVLVNRNTITIINSMTLIMLV